MFTYEALYMLFLGDGTLERKLCALKVNIGCSALKALTRSALGRLGAGKVNGLGSLPCVQAG